MAEITFDTAHQVFADMLARQQSAPIPAQPEDRITRILKKGSQFNAEQHFSDLTTAIFAARRANTVGAHRAGRPGKSIGELMNAMKAQRIQQAESQAKIQIADEKLQLDRRKTVGEEVKAALAGKKEKRLAASDNVKAVEAIMSPYKTAVTKGTFPVAKYQEAYQAVTDAVIKKGAITPTEVQRVASETLSGLGLPEIARIEEIGNEIVQITRDENGQLQAKSLYKTTTKPGRNPYTPQGPYVNEQGSYVGEGHFDKKTGQRFLLTKDSKVIPMPPNVRPITETGLLKNQMSAQQFAAWTTETFDAESSLRKLTEYWSKVKTSEQGWELLADQLIGQLKTVFGEDLTQEEFDTLVSKGLLQGTLGQLRLEVVGGGVMTEIDAQRIIARVGGDISMFRNKKVVANLIKSLMIEKARRYNETLLPMYNMQLVGARGQFYQQKERIDLDPSMFESAEALTAAEKRELEKLRKQQ